MIATVQQVVFDTLECLMALIRDGVRPPEARARLQLVGKRYPGLGMNLLWEEEAYDKSVHYDVLLRLAEGATVSLSFCQPNAMPWPLRGAKRWTDAELLRVNEITLRVAQAMACLDFIWNDAPMMTRLIDLCLIQEEFDREPIDSTDAEIQAAMDGFRRAQKLYTVEATNQWMHQRSMTHEQLERLVTDNLALAKLRDRIAGDRVAGYFEDHRDDFDVARIARIEFSAEDDARRIGERLCTGEITFYEAAQSEFLMAAGRQKAEETSLFTCLRRRDGSGGLANAVFAAAAGSDVGPVQAGDRFVIARVLSFSRAQLDQQTQDAIKRVLFEQWLAERRRRARIQWYWGNAVQTYTSS